MLGLGRKKTVAVKLLGEMCLHQKAKPVEKITEETRNLGAQLVETMYKHDGVGLAATQIGVALRMVALHVDLPKDASLPLSPGQRELCPKMPIVLVNPRILSASSVTDSFEEGCLSVPEVYAPVERPVSVVLAAQLLDGPEFTLDCGGFLARAIQHELDHLDGIVYVQRVKSPFFEEILPELKKIIKKSGAAKSYKIKRIV